MHDKGEGKSGVQIVAEALAFLMTDLGTGGQLRICRDAQGRTHISGNVEEFGPIVRLLGVAGREVIIDEPLLKPQG